MVQGVMRDMDGKFLSMSEAILNRLDEMSTRIDDLERQLYSILTLSEEDSDESDGDEEAAEGGGRRVFFCFPPSPPE